MEYIRRILSIWRRADDVPSIHLIEAALGEITYCRPELPIYAAIDLSDVDDPQELQLQRSVLDFITTEAAYIRALKTAVEVWLYALEELQRKNFLPDVKTKIIFSNLPEILETHIASWEKHIYPTLLEASGKRLKHHSIIDVLSGFKEAFQLYTYFIFENEKAQEYTHELFENDPHYKCYQEWCESQMGHYRFSDVMQKPSSHFIFYVEKTNEMYRQSNDIKDVIRLINIQINISNVLSKINFSMRYFNEIKTVNILIENIKNVDLLNQKDSAANEFYIKLCKLKLREKLPKYFPKFHRAIMLEGALLCKDMQLEREIEVHGILLTDVLLICTPESEAISSVKIIRQHILTKSLHIHPEYEMKAGVKVITSIRMSIADEYDICVSEKSEPRNSNSCNLTASLTLLHWLRALLESRTTLELLDKILIEDQGAHLDCDFGNKTYQYASGEVFLESMEAMQPSVEKAAKQRVLTMIHGANLITRQHSYDDLEERHVLDRPSTSRALHQ